ncbi:MAG: class I SAM-dependent methyltransferase [Patescibacteria group bacterium]
MGEETVSSIRRYYDQQTGEIPSGTGLAWYLGRDQLHPSMVDDERIWNSQRGWLEGAKQTVKDLIKRLGIKKEHLVLDVGSGIGGVGRIVAEETGARVIELNISRIQLATSKMLSHVDLNAEYGRIKHLQANGLDMPIKAGSVDRIISVNMFYHFSNLKNAIRECSRVLKRGGRQGSMIGS